MLFTSVNKFRILPITFLSLPNKIFRVLVVFAVELKKTSGLLLDVAF